MIHITHRIYCWKIGKSPPFPAWAWCRHRMVPVIKVPADTTGRGGRSSSFGTHGIQLPAAPPPAAPAAVPDRRAPPRGRHGCCYCSSGRDRCRRSSPAALTALTPPGAAAKPALGPPSDPGSARHCVPAHAGRRRRALRQQREGVKLVGGLSSHVVPAEAGCSYYRCGRCSSHLQYEAAQVKESK